MTENLSYERLFEDDVPLSSTASRVITNNDYDFNKYDPYVEKIRTLFVPSLEPRIYSCLETFVYRRNSEQHSDSPYLRKCLDVAATWRYPVEAFCTKWRDSGFLEKMLTSAIKFLVRDGLVDCFLNSIILNNRLNKVCRDLDDLGVEKDLLRHLAVWNYINERDYWLEDDNDPSAPKSNGSNDSIERHSDLDVEVGSGTGDRRNGRFLRKALKRRVTDDSSEDMNANSNVHKNKHIAEGLPSRLSIDASNPQGSRSSSERRKIRYCRPSTCSTYRMKNLAPPDCEEKKLKFRIYKVLPGTAICGSETANLSQLSELPLPCKFDDLIGEIVGAGSTSDGAFFNRRRKTLQGAVTSVCYRINETMAKMNGKQVRRCRLHCEVLRGCVSFKLIERETNGCKVCIFDDRVIIDQSDEPGVLGETSVELREVDQQKNPEEADYLEIHKNTGFTPGDDESRIVGSFEEETIIKAEPNIGIFLRVSDDAFDNFRTNLDRLNRKKIVSTPYENGDPVWGSNPSLPDDDELGDDNDDENGVELWNNSRELVRIESKNSSKDNPIIIDNAYDGNCHAETLDRLSAKNEENDKITSPENTRELTREESSNRSANNTQELSRGESSNRSANDTQELSRRESSNRSANNTQELSRGESSNRSANNTQELSRGESSNRSANYSQELSRGESSNRSANNTQELSLGKSSNRLENDIIEDRKLEDPTSFDDNVDHLDRAIEANDDVQAPGHRPDISDSIPDYLHDAVIFDSTHKEAANDVKVVEDRQNVYKSSSNESRQSHAAAENDVQLSCACPSDCTCQNKFKNEDQPEECNSNCFCDTCAITDRSTSSKKIEIIRMSSLLNCGPSETLVPEVQNPREAPTTTRNDFSQSASKESLCSCLKVQIGDPDFQNRGSREGTLMKSEISLQSNVTRAISFIEAESEQTLHLRKPVRPFSSSIHESPRKRSTGERPTVSPRPPRLKGQKINISIEVCPDSESSNGNIPRGSKNVPRAMLPDEFKGHRDVPLFRTPRCQSVGLRSSGKQELVHTDKNTNDECSKHSRRIDAGLHSPPRPQESRDYLPPFEPPPSMRNPFVYGMPTKSGIRSVDKFERRSTSRDKRQRGGKSSYEFDENFGRPKNPIRNIGSKERNNKRDETPKAAPRMRRKPEMFSPFAIQNNLCHAFSASSVDRMKHLIRTKLRRILLERDKATNTPKKIVTNKNYRVSVPIGKSDRSSFRKQRCRTIWESRSASDSVHTSRSLATNERNSSPGIRDADDEVNNRFFSTLEPEVSSVDDQDLGRQCRNSRIDRRTVENCRVSAGDSNANFRRLAGGSDIPFLKFLDAEVSLKNNRHNSTRESGESEQRCGSDSKHEKFDATAPKRNGNDASKANGEAMMLRKQTETEKLIHELPESGRLDWSGNSTSRHICLYEFDQLEPSYDEKESPRCRRKDYRYPGQIRENLRNYSRKLDKPRHRKSQLAREISIGRNVSAVNNFSPEINTIDVSTIRPKGFRNLDQDLRTKLSQYVSLCKNVKYSLLKRLRPDDIYEASVLRSCEDLPDCNKFQSRGLICNRNGTGHNRRVALMEFPRAE